MENILDPSKTSPKSSPKNTIYNTPKQFNKISHYETDIGNNIIHSNESLSNIIDIISNNNLNLFYQDDSYNFKRNIDSLNLKFYLETEKMLSSNMSNSSNLFFILFKQITLYIKEIERLNIIILGLKKDQESSKKMEYFIQKREMDFENKINMINALRYSKDDLEKKVNSLMVSENNLKKENMRLIQENMFYKNNSNSNNNIINNITYIDSKDNEKHKIISSNEKKKYKEELYINKKYIKTNSNLINSNKKNYIYNNLKHNSISSNKENKINKEISKIYKNNGIDTKSIMISVKRDENLLLKGHRRNYSDQIGIGINAENLNFNISKINKINNSNNSNKKKLKSNNTIKINKNNIISFGVSTPKNKPVQIKHNQLSDIKLNQISKYKNSKSIKNKKEKKLFNKKKTYNIINNFSNKSIHIDFKSNNKNNNLMKCSSLVFNSNNNIKEKINENKNINPTESNYEISLGNEIDELTMIENLLNQVKDYINSNRNTKNNICKTSPKIK
jgi:hypothetical protein